MDRQLSAKRSLAGAKGGRAKTQKQLEALARNRSKGGMPGKATVFREASGAIYATAPIRGKSTQLVDVEFKASPHGGTLLLSGGRAWLAAPWDLEGWPGVGHYQFRYLPKQTYADLLKVKSPPAADTMVKIDPVKAPDVTMANLTRLTWAEFCRECIRITGKDPEAIEEAMVERPEHVRITESIRLSEPVFAAYGEEEGWYMRNWVYGTGNHPSVESFVLVYGNNNTAEVSGA